MKKFKEFLRFAGVPFILIGILLFFMVVRSLFSLPTREELVQLAERYYEIHGYWVVFLGALAEGFLVLNWYLPGSVVIVFGVVFAAKNSLNVVSVIGLITTAFFLTTVLNYALGRYGWYRLLLKFGLREPLEVMKRRVERSGQRIIFATYFHPNIGALTATCAGILKFPFLRFLLYSLLALVAWNSFWGFVVYAIGPVILNFFGIAVIFVVLLLWILFLVFRFLRLHKTLPPNIP